MCLKGRAGRQEWGGKQISSCIRFSARVTRQRSTAGLGKGEKGHFNQSHGGKHRRCWTSVKCQQVINLLANGKKKKITTGSWESRYNETATILDALIINKASQPHTEISKWLRDRFSFAVPSLALADPGAGSWLQSCWQTLFGVEFSGCCLQGSQW